MVFRNVIVDITISRRSFVFSQSCVKVPTSSSDVGGLESEHLNNKIPDQIIGVIRNIILSVVLCCGPTSRFAVL